MAEIPLEAMFFGDDGDNDSDSESDENDDDVVEYDGISTTMDEEFSSCSKLKLAENLAAHKEKRVLLRDSESIPCTSSLVHDVTLNYIIAKQIISNLPWQEKMICKRVCSTWHSAVQALRKEQMGPQDFFLNVISTTSKGGTTFVQSGPFYTKPLVVMTFVNTSGFALISECESLTPNPCKNQCEKEHSLLDFVNHKANAPKNRMHSIKANYISYLPLPHSPTYQHTIMHLRNIPVFGGVHIPIIPEVEFHTIHLKASTMSIKEDFYDVVGRLSETRIFKGILVYITERYLLHTVEDIVFLNYFKDVQPEIPYALGGCIIEDTAFDENDIKLIVEGINDGIDYMSDNLLSIGLFTVPKNSNNSEYNFEMFSFVLESSDWSKPKIQQSINEFASRVPKFEHSVAVKLSCVGRDQKHKMEQELFRIAFPNTRILGCYGNGELGLNHPARPATCTIPNAAKRHRLDPGPQYGIMYSYSTVFVYIGWGKILSAPTKPNSSS